MQFQQSRLAKLLTKGYTLFAYDSGMSHFFTGYTNLVFTAGCALGVPP